MKCHRAQSCVAIIDPWMYRRGILKIDRLLALAYSVYVLQLLRLAQCCDLGLWCLGGEWEEGTGRDMTAS